MITISIVIPNLNSPIIDRTLTSIRRQTYSLDRVEVIVVGMDEHGLVEEDDLVRHRRTEQPRSPAAARNLGIQAARGEILCFTDADCVADPNWLAVLMARYTDPSVEVIGGGVDFPSDNYWTLSDNLSWFYEVLAGAAPATRLYLPTLNLSLRREVIEDVGLIDESYPRPAGEDTEWTTRMRLAGHTLHFEPRAIVHHHHRRSSVGRILKHAFYFGRHSVRVDPRYAKALGSPSVLYHPVPLILLSPILAAGATARVFVAARRYWHTMPAIYLTKLSWCLGAAVRWRAGPAS